MYYPGANKPTSREEWEERTLSRTPEVRRQALKHLHDEGFYKGILLCIGIAVARYLIINW